MSRLLLLGLNRLVLLHGGRLLGGGLLGRLLLNGSLLLLDGSRRLWLLVWQLLLRLQILIGGRGLLLLRRPRFQFRLSLLLRAV